MLHRRAFNFWTSSCTAVSRTSESRSILVYLGEGSPLAIVADPSVRTEKLSNQ